MDARLKLAVAAALPALLIALDRILKHHAQAAPSFGTGAVSFGGPTYGFYLNEGLLFSSFGPRVATAASALAFLGLAAIALYRAKSAARIPASAVFASLLIALGGASNVFDRLRYGGVVDYFLFARSAWNIADIMILAGLALTLAQPKGGKRAGEQPR